jgi:hypothetical protein
MPDDSSAELRGLLARLRSGEPVARDVLHQAVYRHMRRIAGRMTEAEERNGGASRIHKRPTIE